MFRSPTVSSSRQQCAVLNSCIAPYRIASPWLLRQIGLPCLPQHLDFLHLPEAAAARWVLGQPSVLAGLNFSQETTATQYHQLRLLAWLVPPDVSARSRRWHWGYLHECTTQPAGYSAALLHSENSPTDILMAGAHIHCTLLTRCAILLFCCCRRSRSWKRTCMQKL